MSPVLDIHQAIAVAVVLHSELTVLADGFRKLSDVDEELVDDVTLTPLHAAIGHSQEDIPSTRSDLPGGIRSDPAAQLQLGLSNREQRVIWNVVDERPVFLEVRRAELWRLRVSAAWKGWRNGHGCGGDGGQQNEQGHGQKLQSGC